MATFKELGQEDVKTGKSNLNQLIDIVNTDISGTTSRKKYQVWVTGGLGPGVTSSLFQTVFDQDFTLQTANSVFDITFGIASSSTNAHGTLAITTASVDSNGKYIFPSWTVQMREKMDVYKLFAQQLLGDGESKFVTKNAAGSTEIDDALFVCFKRLFARDQIKRETFAIRMNVSGYYDSSGDGNLGKVSDSPAKIFTDVGSATNKDFEFGGQVSNVVDSSNTSFSVGQLFIDRGVLVLDMNKVFDMEQTLSGVLDSVSTSGQTAFSQSMRYMVASASIDDVLDHICMTRFSGSDETSITFQNVTNINSTIYFCRLAADEFNYSSNTSYLDDNNRIVVIDEGQEETQKSFTFITSVGLYDAFDNLLGVAKLSRPVIKDSDRDLTIKVRLDW
jgi:hypothetical protein